MVPLAFIEECEGDPGYVAKIHKAFRKNLEQNTKFIQSGLKKADVYDPQLKK